MKIMLLATAAAAAIAAAPAAAQYRTTPYYGTQPGYDYDEGAYGGDRIARLMERVARGVRDGSITRGEALNLNNQLRQFDRLERQYARNGLSAWERRDLAQRLMRFRADLRTASGRGYGGRYGDDRYDDDRYDDDRYDDRRYDRRGGDDRWDDDGRYDDDDDGYREPLGM